MNVFIIVEGIHLLEAFSDEANAKIRAHQMQNEEGKSDLTIHEMKVLDLEHNK